MEGPTSHLGDLIHTIGHISKSLQNKSKKSLGFRHTLSTDWHRAWSILSDTLWEGRQLADTCLYFNYPRAASRKQTVLNRYPDRHLQGSSMQKLTPSTLCVHFCPILAIQASRHCRVQGTVGFQVLQDPGHCRVLDTVGFKVLCEPRCCRVLGTVGTQVQ